MDVSNDTIDVPPGELFASADEKVICWKGKNYYLACGEHVFDKPEGGTTSCVVPKALEHWNHVDAYGITFDNHFSPVTPDARDRDDARKLLLRTGLEEEQIFNALNALLHNGFRIERRM